MAHSSTEANPIIISPSSDEYVVQSGGVELARSRRALLLEEPEHDLRVYFPRDDVHFTALIPHDTITTCSLKGVASEYWAVADAPDLAVAWSYPSPVPHVDAIRGHVSFYTDRVEVARSN